MKKTSIKTNVALNMVKQGLSLLFPLITVPYVSQHLGVQGYGEYNYAASIVSYLSYFAAMGISTYAVREGALLRNDRQAEEKLCSQLFTINIITTCIAMGIISFYCFYGIKTTAEKEYIFILSLSIVFTTIGVEWINQIYEDFAFLTIRYIVIQLLSIILLFMFVKTTADVAQYCLVTVIASAGAGVLNIFHILFLPCLQFV